MINCLQRTPEFLTDNNDESTILETILNKDYMITLSEVRNILMTMNQVLNNGTDVLMEL